ncbi:hypothetical protein SBOR_7486 [Sclerotinia borealis F-4128]|uniref:Uncharacterized protein n=1 Tax=Sclerotinia borealis (strain F-4128) TaxID=1432307 RepID=W9CC30_SCLBF|nr:hypothetical protein SBOR_7486 [Sclerotinia borealis F-4128]
MSATSVISTIPITSARNDVDDTKSILRLPSEYADTLPTNHDGPAQRPAQIDPHFTMWVEIAQALGVPTTPSHPLTADALFELAAANTMAQSEDATTSELARHQSALFLHRIFKWINSGALEGGIDGNTNGAPFIYPLSSFWGSDASETWSFEILERYWQNEPDDEQIIHRSISVPESESSGSPEPSDASEDEDEDGGVLIDTTSSSDGQNQMVFDLFRTRELQRLVMGDSPILSRIDPNVFRTNAGPGKHARARALTLTERIAQGANQRQEELRNKIFPVVPLRNQVFPVIPTEQPITTEEVLDGYYEPITLANFL